MISLSEGTAPNRICISSNTTLKNKFDNFLSKNCKYFTYSAYYAVFRKDNIGFGEP